MLGFHRRTRSLIPVKDLAKYDKVPLNEQEELFPAEEEEVMGLHRVTDDTIKQKNRQLMLVYLIFLGEA